MRKLIPISEAAKLLGVPADTLRRWEREGKIKPRRTSGNLRRYDIADIRPDLVHAAPTALRAARRRHHRGSPWRPEAGRRTERREARACRRSYSGGVVVARGACRRAADECGEQRDGHDGGPFHGDLLLKKVGRAAKRRRSATANYKLTMPIGNWPAFAVG
jgi:excisionase family DNA binding protein